MLREILFRLSSDVFYDISSWASASKRYPTPRRLNAKQAWKKRGKTRRVK